MTESIRLEKTELRNAFKALALPKAKNGSYFSEKYPATAPDYEPIGITPATRSDALARIRLDWIMETADGLFGSGPMGNFLDYRDEQTDPTIHRPTPETFANVLAVIKEVTERDKAKKPDLFPAHNAHWEAVVRTIIPVLAAGEHPEHAGAVLNHLLARNLIDRELHDEIGASLAGDTVGAVGRLATTRAAGAADRGRR